MNQSLMSTYAVKVNDINPETKQKMYSLYAKYYDSCSEELFYSDLDQKNNCIILENKQNANIIGFTTIENYQYTIEEKKYNFVFSGDTIIEQEYWGKNPLASKWLSFAGAIKRKHPNIPLYWFIIVKGHRTYRYLKVYSKSYYPHYHIETPSNIKNILDFVALKKFGKNYNKQTGIISFDQSHGHLKKNIADVPEKNKIKPEVAYFLEKNPNYYKGDELACICELSDDNLQKISKYHFNQEI